MRSMACFVILFTGGWDNPCTGHGICHDGRLGTGNCDCDPGWFGTACDQQCPPNATHPCNDHGKCDDGSTGSGKCDCDYDFTNGFWVGSTCNDCQPGVQHPLPLQEIPVEIHLGMLQNGLYPPLYDISPAVF